MHYTPLAGYCRACTALVITVAQHRCPRCQQPWMPVPPPTTRQLLGLRPTRFTSQEDGASCA